MMRLLCIAFSVFLSVAIQATWLAQLNLPGQVKPDLVMVIVISYALLKGPYVGANVGLFSGFFMDLVSGSVIGGGVLTKLAAGLTAGILEKTIFKDNLLVPTIAVFFGTVIYETINLIIRLSFGANLAFFQMVLHIILPMALYNAILAPIIYQLLYTMERMISERTSDF